MPRLIEGIVCSLKWSKLLQEAAIRQDTLFHWVRVGNGEFILFGQESVTYGHLERYAAYTAQEFVDLFPVLFKISRKENEWQFLSKEFHMHLKNEENLSNVLARILLRLLKTDPHLVLENCKNLELLN